MVISLTGFMGCGKSTAGRALAEVLGAEFIDLDDYIVSREGKTIPDIFATRGEPGFRNVEKECLLTILGEHCGRQETLVLALGGGTVTTPECADAIYSGTTCIYMEASEKELGSNLAGAEGRPMLKNNTVSELLKSRAPLYEKVSHYRIHVDGLDNGDIVRKLLETVNISMNNTMNISLNISK